MGVHLHAPQPRAFVSDSVDFSANATSFAQTLKVLTLPLAALWRYASAVRRRVLDGVQLVHARRGRWALLACVLGQLLCFMRQRSRLCID